MRPERCGAPFGYRSQSEGLGSIAANNLWYFGRVELWISRVFPFWRIRQEEIGAAFQSALLQDGFHDLFRGAWVCGGFENDELPGAQARGNRTCCFFNVC